MSEYGIILFYLVGMVIMVMLSLVGKVNISLMFLVPLIPLQNVLNKMQSFPFGKDFGDIILGAMIIGWVFRSVVQKEKIFEPTPVNKILFVTALFTYISLWQGSFYLGEPAPLNPGNWRLQTWKNYMMLPLIYFITVNNIKSVKQIRWLFVLMLLGTLVVDYYTARQIQWSPGLASRDRLVGTTVWLGPNQVASFYVQCIFLLIGMLIISKEKLYRLGSLALILVSVYITLFLYSRGAYVALIAGLMTIGILKMRSLILPLLVLLMFWDAILPEKVIERVKETQTQEGTLDSSSQHRLELWEESFELFKESPLTGIGFDVISQKGLLTVFKDTHNIYLKFLAEGGIVGFGLLMALFIASFRCGYLLFKRADDYFLKGLGLGFAACVIATMVTNLFGDRWTFMQISVYYWVALAMVVRGLIIVEENSRGQEVAV